MGEMRDRLLGKIEETERGCWEWQGYISPEGYGSIKIGSRTDGTRRTALAHRVSYEEFVGPIPEDLVLDHLCRNRRCINPVHLEAVTMRENTLRGDTIPAENAAKTRCPVCDAAFVYRWGRRHCPDCTRSYNTEWKRRSRNAA